MVVWWWRRKYPSNFYANLDHMQNMFGDQSYDQVTDIKIFSSFFNNLLGKPQKQSSSTNGRAIKRGEGG